jgi:hypothetical protein
MSNGSLRSRKTRNPTSRPFVIVLVLLLVIETHKVEHEHEHDYEIKISKAGWLTPPAPDRSSSSKRPPGADRYLRRPIADCDMPLVPIAELQRAMTFGREW